ncbi:MAG: hypothetical protein ACFB2Z_05865 [Maricaulaceae bacterium]
MSEAILEALTRLDGVTVVNAASLEPYLAEDTGRLTCLFFSGDPVSKLETADVAVVVRELLSQYGESLRVGLIDREDETGLMRACSVFTLPSLAFFQGVQHLETIPKIQDWSVYAQKTSALLARVAPQAAE